MHYIEFIGGGPLDGDVMRFDVLPRDDWEITSNAHSYTFNAAEERFEYQQRWRNITIGNSLLTYRTFGEALRQLGQLQVVGAISAAESLDYQALIKKGLRRGHI